MNMATLFLQYPACSTCQKAKKWLTENNIEFTNRLIIEENPTVEELKAWILVVNHICGIYCEYCF